MDAGVVEKIKEARSNIDAGETGAALGALEDVVHATRDPGLLREMHDLAQRGLGEAGRFSKRGWTNLVEDLDQQLALVG